MARGAIAFAKKSTPGSRPSTERQLSKRRGFRRDASPPTSRPPEPQVRAFLRTLGSLLGFLTRPRALPIPEKQQNAEPSGSRNILREGELFSCPSPMKGERNELEA